MLLGMLLLMMVVGSVLGLIAFAQVSKVQQQQAQLQRELTFLHQQLSALNQASPTPAAPQPIMSPPAATHPVAPPSTPAPAANQPKPAQTTTARPTTTTRPSTPSPLDILLSRAKDQWMIWLGGLMLSLAGIFLAKYSIERGFLGPTARIVMSLLTGLALHGGAHYLRLKRGHHDALAALAGAGSITLFGAVLAALNLYHLITPGWAFLGLVSIALATTALALVHGPILAAIGLLGAYCVPILVDTGSGNVAGALMYVTAINLGALLLLRYVYRTWLWLGIIGFTGFWWLVAYSRMHSNYELISLALTLYVAVFAYALFAAPRFDWLLQQASPEPAITGWRAFWQSAKAGHFYPRNFAVLIALLLLQAVQLATIATGHYNLLQTLLLPTFILYLASSKPLFTPLAWGSLVATIIALLLAHWTPTLPTNWRPLNLEQQHQFAILLTAIVALFSGAALFNLRRGFSLGHWSSLAALTPLFTLVPGYFLLPALTSNLSWALAATAIACLYLGWAIWLANHHRSTQAVLALTIAAHLGYSLAVLFIFERTTLTLLLAVQVLSLSYLRKRFDANQLGWIIKALVAVVVIRLSANPFIFTYPEQDQWLIGTYALCAGLCYLAGRIDASPRKFNLWLEAAALHLFTLFVLLQVRYWMNQGEVFEGDYTLAEAGLQTLTWGLLGQSYSYRARFADHLALLYRFAGNLLRVMAIVNYALFVLFFLNPLLNSHSQVEGVILFNTLLLCYGLPALALLWQSYQERGNTAWLALAAMVASVLFVSLELRFSFGSNVHHNRPTGDPEVYSYSLAWMIMAIVGMVVGIRQKLRFWYPIALGLLLLVIVKLFLIDMSDLKGLLRVASFMGMGLSLLVLAYGHRFLTAHDKTASTHL